LRVAAAALVVLAALAVAGCGAEDETQEFARHAVESHVAGDPAYDASDVRCTPNPRPWFVEEQANVVICRVLRTDGGCDRFRVDLVRDTVRVTARIRLDARDAGCVLPA